MKKRALSLLLTLCMVLSLLPTALAASEPVIVAPLSIAIPTAKDDGLLVKNTEYYKNLDHATASKLISDAQSGALKEPFVLVCHSRNCVNSKSLMSIIRKYADDNKMTIYTIDNFNTLGGSVKDGGYLFDAIKTSSISYPVTFAFDGTTLHTRQLAVPTFSVGKFVDYMDELGFIGLKHAGATSPVVLGKDAKNLAEIKAKWAALKPQYTGELYKTKPDAFFTPYKLGEVSEGILQDGVNMANFVRYVAHLPDDLVLDKALNNQAQHGALTIATIDEVTHTPKKSKDLSQAMYDIGYASASSSNLAKGPSDAHSLVLGFMSDSDTSNIGAVGHRRWILNPPLKKTGFGFSSLMSTNFSAMQVFDKSRSESVEYDFVSWPTSGYHPTEMFNKNDAWSASLNPDVFDVKRTGDIQVKLTAKDGTVTTFSAADTNKSGKYFNVETSNVGTPFAVIFRPLTGYKQGDSYGVEISGLYRKGTGKPVSIKYTTNFISLEGAEGAKNDSVTVPVNFSIAQQRAKWEQLKPSYTGSQFAEEPSIVAPYKLGTLADDSLKDASNMIAFMRYIAGRDEAMPSLDSTMVKDNQYLAFRNAINNTVSYSKMPADVPFQLLRNSYSPSTVFFKGVPGSTLTENMKQSAATYNILIRSLNAPGRSGMGFGHTPQGFSTFEVWTASDKNYKSDVLLTWPAAGYHPIEFTKDRTNWSLALDNKVYDYSKVSDYRLTLTGPNGTTTPTIRMGPACLVFFDNVIDLNFYAGAKFYAGDVFKVTLENVYKIGDGTPYTLEYTVNLFALDPNAPPPAPHSINMITKSGGSIKVGDTFQMEHTIAPQQASQAVTYELSDPSLATVSATGLITALKVGKLTITVKAGSVRTTFPINININAPTAVALDKTTHTAYPGDTLQLNHTFTPADAAGMVTYSTSNSAVATVSTNGLVTIKKAGTATITAKTGKLTATCTITVKNIEPASLDLGAPNLTLDAGMSLLLEPVVAPAGAVGTVTYTSSDSSVATISSTGLITTKKAGTTTITGRVGGVSATCVITVEGKPVKGLTLGTKPTKIDYLVGEKFNSAGFTATYSDGKTVKELKASDMKFGSVSLATVGNKTVTATYGGLSVNFTITVNKEVAPVTKPEEKPEAKPEEKPEAKPVTPPAAAAATATPSPTRLTVNGKAVSIDAYAINQNNYIKLRDLAYVINGTGKNFEVQWDGTKNAINLISNAGYTATKSDMAPGDGQVKNATLATSAIYVDGVEKSLTAYVLGQNNYFKLRDVMQVFDVGVGYDGATGTATLDTGKGYEAPATTPAPATPAPVTPASTGAVADGVYRIKPFSAMDFEICVDAQSTKDNAVLTLWKAPGGDNHRFQFTANANGDYTITAVHSGKAITSGGAKGSKLMQGSSGRTFALVPVGSGTYRIQDTASGLYLGVSGGTMKNGTNIILWEKAGDNSQVFILERQ